MRRLELAVLAVITLAYLGIAALYAIKTPAWQVPDEPAHYNYIAQIATQGCCLTLHPGDWDNAYLDSIKAARFSPASLQGRLNTVRYEDHQPPLYYLLAAPIYTLSGGSLTALRLLSVVLGAGVLILAWAIIRVIFPAQPWLALAAAAFVAFLPQHVAMMAGVDNDSLAELVIALALLAAMLYLRDGSQSRKIHPAILGVLAGIGFVTKLTAYFPLIAVIGLAFLWRARCERWNLAGFVKQAAWILVPALLIGGVWWVRNIATYGSLQDFMVQKTHDAVVVGQMRVSEYIAGLDRNPVEARGIGGWLRDGVVVTFHSFWGQFGWMGVLMPNSIYNLLLAFTAFVTVGAVIALFRFWRASSTFQRVALSVLAAAALMALVETVGYNLTFVQFQGRYLYPGLIPIALFMAVGLAGWVSLIARRVWAAWWIVPGLMGLFAVLDVYALFRIILPQLA